ncbi:sugar ABC transporter permease [Chengkuizengella axinellae]|uniref:Xylose transport system permease protein XylH n=1 Tax=Chengkuizengella axinellae TaxID=3064388 RepID=A0ABT9J3X2_9BACL|nr:sugar ABC transporter permease [Chengkuizengella sp. 2205SS18-9]MDP5276294.1 sugar ABC transporter permease [Chengkuizengella sp. 2205SS18-9]
MSTNTELVQNKQKVKWIAFDLRAYTMIAALVLIWILFTFLSGGSFIEPRNLSNLFNQMSVTSVLAVGMVLIIVAGHIDLSVGSLVGLTGGVAAILNSTYDWNAIVVFAVTIAFGALVGLWQGWWVAYRAVPAFIVTLGGMLIFRGVLLGISDSRTISGLSDGFKTVGTGYVPQEWGIVVGVLAVVVFTLLLVLKRVSRKKFGFDIEPMVLSLLKIVLVSIIVFTFVLAMNDYKGIPIPIFVVIFLAIIFTFIAKNTVYGRQIYAIGGNPEAARLSGINIKRRTLMLFVLGNTLAAIAGILLTARVGSATVNAGTMYELDAIAAAVIGGTSLLGGAGTISGAIIGALVMASLDNGMSLMSVETFWQYIVKGGILILAVWMDIYSRQRKNKG